MYQEDLEQASFGAGCSTTTVFSTICGDLKFSVADQGYWNEQNH